MDESLSYGSGFTLVVDVWQVIIYILILANNVTLFIRFATICTACMYIRKW